MNRVSNQNYSKKDLDLTKDEDYYSNEANWQYMSVSQYKDFMSCEAAALAKLKGDWEPTSDPIALLVGNYVHSYFETPEAHKKFKSYNASELFKEGTVADYKKALETAEIPFKKNAKKDELLALLEKNEIDIPVGDIRSEFKTADKMIKRVEKDPLFNYLWQGDKEVPITGNLYGIEWKGKIDLLNVEKGYFVDLKTSAQLDKRFWSKDYGRYVSFVEAFGYVIQLGIYEQLLEMKYGKPFTGYIYAVSKQDSPNIEAIEVDDFKKRTELGFVKQRIDRVEAVKTGQEEPEMCGKCDYCREHKQLDGFIESDLLID